MGVIVETHQGRLLRSHLILDQMLEAYHDLSDSKESISIADIVIAITETLHDWFDVDNDAFLMNIKCHNRDLDITPHNLYSFVFMMGVWPIEPIKKINGIYKCSLGEFHFSRKLGGKFTV